MRCGAVCCGVVCCGVLCYGVLYCGLVWCAVVWCGTAWCCTQLVPLSEYINYLFYQYILLGPRAFELELLYGGRDIRVPESLGPPTQFSRAFI